MIFITDGVLITSVKIGSRIVHRGEGKELILTLLFLFSVDSRSIDPSGGERWWKRDEEIFLIARNLADKG